MEDGNLFESASVMAETWLLRIHHFEVTSRDFSRLNVQHWLSEIAQFCGDVVSKLELFERVISRPTIVSAIILANDSTVRVSSQIFDSAHHAAYELTREWIFGIWSIVEKPAAYRFALRMDSEFSAESVTQLEDHWPVVDFIRLFEQKYEIDSVSQNLAVLIRRERTRCQLHSGVHPPAVIKNPTNDTIVSAESEFTKSGRHGRDHTDDVSLSGSDGPTGKGIRLGGIEYTLSPRASKIVKMVWSRDGMSMPILDASDDHAVEMTLGQAKARQKDFNKAVAGSGWEMSLAEERFTIKKIE